MSKKIKITEDQLKRLMVLKEENQGFDDFDTQIQPEELPSAEYEGVDDMNNSNDELERMADSFIKQYKEKAVQGIDNDMIDNLCDKIRQGLSGEESQSNYEMPGYKEDMDNLNNLSIREDDDTVNESVEKIKNNFKRFL